MGSARAFSQLRTRGSTGRVGIFQLSGSTEAHEIGLSTSMGARLDLQNRYDIIFAFGGTELGDLSDRFFSRSGSLTQLAFAAIKQKPHSRIPRL